MACGCNDTSIPLVNCNDGCDDCPPTNTTSLPDCPPSSEACEELVYSECTLYKGPNLPALGINNLDRFITVLTKLHRVINDLITPEVPIQTYTLTNTLTNGTPYVVTYLGLGPVYTSTAGATSSGTTITVGSTTGLQAGMTCELTAGTGTLATDTTVLSVTNSTTFVVSDAPTVALSGGLTVIKCTGLVHTIYKTTVVNGTPQSIKAFTGSPVVVSGTGTIV